MQSDNKNLHLFTCEWIKYIVNNNPNEIIKLIHPIVNPDGTPMLCECGLMYTEESRIEEGTCNLYTHVGVAHIKYYGLKCNMNKCEKKFCDISGTWGMFFYTNTMCAGDEISWDFINAGQDQQNILHWVLQPDDTDIQDNLFRSTGIYVSENLYWLVFRVAVSIQD